MVAFFEGFAYIHPMETSTAATVFAELGNRTRLDILRLLIKAGPDGLPIGDIQARLDIPASTLAFHLRGLLSAQLIDQEKQGRTVLCRPCLNRVNDAISFLKEECCLGVGKKRPRRARAA
jgi:DNA-binding transcriptional ArsR family regulator